MTEKQIKIVNETGLHARPASDFVNLAGKFDSDIHLRRLDDEDQYNAKSIVMLLALGLEQGEDAILSAHGPDEAVAIDQLSKLIAGFTD